MTKKFRKKNDDGYYKKVVNTFFDCIDEACSYGKGKGQTKAYATKK